MNKQLAAKDPLVRDLEAVVCWVNTWADEPPHDTTTSEWRAGYEKCVGDVMERLKPLAPDWLDSWRAGVRK